MSESTNSEHDALNLGAIMEALLNIQQNSGVLTTVQVDRQRGTMAVVKPALAHLITESENYSALNLKWDDVSDVKLFFKKLSNFLSSTEKQIGKNSLATLLEHVMDKVFSHTPFHGLAIGAAKDGVHWKLIIKEFREALSIPAIDYSLDLYNKIENFTPATDSLLRLALIQVLSWIKEASIQIDEILAEAADEANEPDDVSMRSGTASDGSPPDAVGTLDRRQLQGILLPSPVVMAAKIVSWTPIAIKPVLPETLTDTNVRYTVDQFERDLLAALKKIPPATRVSLKKDDKKKDPNNTSSRGTGSGGAQPQQPQQARLGSLVALNPHGVPKQPVSISVLGRCIVTVDDQGHEIVPGKQVRIDTGADESIFDLTLLPYAERLGPSPRSYVTPLSSKARRAELGRVTFAATDVEGQEVTFSLVGVIDPFGSTAFRPDSVSVSAGVGTVAIGGHELPTVAIKNNPYIVVKPIATDTSTKIKTLFDFGRSIGVSIGVPPPRLDIVA